MRVARALGRSHAVVAKEPFVSTAWAHLQLLDLERLDAWQRDAEELRLANRIAMAFNEPTMLSREHADLLARMAAGPGDSSDDARAKGLALAGRIARGQVLLS